MELPVDLQSDSTGNQQQLAVRTLQTMDHVHRTLDSIRYCRATGAYWGALVEHLHNLLGGLRDEQFWDGMPANIRAKVADLERDPMDKKLMREADKIREEWAAYGWNGVKVRAKRNPDGTPRFVPTAQNLDQMLEILMQLLHRKQLLWKTRLYSPLPPLPGDGGGNQNEMA